MPHVGNLVYGQHVRQCAVLALSVLFHQTLGERQCETWVGKQISGKGSRHVPSKEARQQLHTMLHKARLPYSNTQSSTSYRPWHSLQTKLPRRLTRPSRHNTNARHNQQSQLLPSQKAKTGKTRNQTNHLRPHKCRTLT